MGDASERRPLPARAWDEAAPGYERYFVPRFASWVATAVDGFDGAQLPPGPILVPCCGTFPEPPALVERHPRREIVGIDLSAGMLRLARERAAGRPGVRVVQGDAATLDPGWSAACAAVVSVFGLQQLPAPDAALEQWVGALRAGGRLSVPMVHDDAVTFWDAVTSGGHLHALAVARGNAFMRTVRQEFLELAPAGQ
jgi:SAM-dependent methyltransferase